MTPAMIASLLKNRSSTLQMLYVIFFTEILNIAAITHSCYFPSHSFVTMTGSLVILLHYQLAFIKSKWIILLFLMKYYFQWYFYPIFKGEVEFSTYTTPYCYVIGTI